VYRDFLKTIKIDGILSFMKEGKKKISVVVKVKRYKEMYYLINMMIDLIHKLLSYVFSRVNQNIYIFLCFDR